jgi:hypothetical protein
MGTTDVEGMLRKMPMRRLAAWREFDEVDPIGGRRSDWQAASIASATFNAIAMLSGSRHRAKVADFLLTYGEDPKKVGRSKTPAAPWQGMKFTAMMQVALANAEVAAAEARRTRKKRG